MESPGQFAIVVSQCAELQQTAAAAFAQRNIDMSVAQPETVIAMIAGKYPTWVIVDLDTCAFELLGEVVAFDPLIEVLAIGGDASTDAAVAAVTAGAANYFAKPVAAEAIGRHIERSNESRHKYQVMLDLERQAVQLRQLEGIVGRSPKMVEAFTKIARVAPHFQTALITGDTGTGKELAARALHRLSPARAKPFAACNCAAFAESLIESELFGYVRGAFTGAVHDHAGLFEFANGGTVFLDEIGDMSLGTQAKLLRVLQNREILRVGSPVPRPVDVRIIAATNRDLRQMVAENRFRQDLFYRIAVVHIDLPRLADRMEDLPLLQQHFIEQASSAYHKPIRGISRRAQKILAAHDWPGNIRELENVIASACMECAGSVVDVCDLPEYLHAAQPAPKNTVASRPPDALVPLKVLEQQYALEVLEKFAGNKNRAAAALGISRATLYNILQRVPAAR